MKLRIRYYEDCEIIRTTESDSFDSYNNLLDAVYQAVGYEDEELSILFMDYYENYPLMHSERRVPYVFIDGICEWHVLYSDIKIKDFALTHNIDEAGFINVDIGDCFASGDLNLTVILSWYWAIHAGIEFVEDSEKIIGWIKSIYFSLMGKDNKMPDPDEVIEMLGKKECWNIAELKQACKFPSDTITETVLKTAGYEKQKDGSYRKSKNRESEFDYSIWYPNTSSKDCAEIAETIYEINQYYTYLLIQSRIGSDIDMDLYRFILRQYIDDWSDFVHIGRPMHFVELNNDGMRVVDQDYLDDFRRSLSDFHSFLWSTCEYYENKEDTDATLTVTGTVKDNED